MKRILKVLTTLAISSPIALSVVACSNEPNWNNIPISPPKIPIDVTGFKGVDFKSMNIKDYDTVDKLFTAIKDKFKASAWKDDTATTWTGTKDEQPIDLKAKTTDLCRNGQYTFEIKSNLTNNPGDAKIIITITNSRHIADNMKITNLNIIDDTKPKTILIACVFNNMNLVSKINEIADEYLDNMDIETKGKPEVGNQVTGTATLTSPTNINSKDPPYFYGSIKVNFTVKEKAAPAKPTSLKDAIKTTDLGQIPDKRQYTILMYVIIKNFVTKLDSLAEIINNLEIDDMKNTTAKIISTNPQYYTGSVILQFTLPKTNK